MRPPLSKQKMQLKDWVRRVLYIIAIAKKDKDIVYNPEKLTKDFSYLVRKYYGDGLPPAMGAKKIMSTAEKWNAKAEKEHGPLAECVCNMIDEEMGTVLDAPEETSNEDPDGQELLLYIENDSNLYNRWYMPIVKNLVRKQSAGKYDHFLAIKGFLYLVDAGAKQYAKEFEQQEGNWNLIFPKNVRIEVAKQLVDKFERDYEEGQWSQFVPKKYQVKEEENTYNSDELREMEGLLKLNGFNSKEAIKLQKDGIGPEELKERLKIKSGEQGSLEYTHNIHRINMGENNNMKITKKSLLKIIREEIDKVLKEEPINSNPQWGKEEDYSESADESNTPLKEELEELEEEEVRGHGEEDFSDIDHLVAEKKEKLEEVTPPGKEKVVKALKKELPKTYLDKSGERKESNPWSAAWAQYNKEKK